MPEFCSFFTGNHDVWISIIYPKNRIIVHREALNIEINSIKLYIAHGMDLDRGKGYKTPEEHLYK